MFLNNLLNGSFLNFAVEYKYIISLILSVFLGFAIGFERKARSKEAGLRTHTVVCFGSALMMVVSKYGFLGFDSDASRIAAQIVSGIGFLGAGMIVYRKNAIHGLTTAAGVWTTAGIGMACGAELYFTAIVSAALLIIVQYILHIDCNLFKPKRSYLVKVVFYQQTNQNELIKKLFNVQHFQKVVVCRKEKIEWTVTVSTASEIESKRIDEIIKQNDYIVSIERCDE